MAATDPLEVAGPRAGSVRSRERARTDAGCDSRTTSSDSERLPPECPDRRDQVPPAAAPVACMTSGLLHRQARQSAELRLHERQVAQPEAAYAFESPFDDGKQRAIPWRSRGEAEVNQRIGGRYCSGGDSPTASSDADDKRTAASVAGRHMSTNAAGSALMQARPQHCRSMDAGFDLSPSP